MPDVVSAKLRALETAETLTETVKGPKREKHFSTASIRYLSIG